MVKVNQSTIFLFFIVLIVVLAQVSDARRQSSHRRGSIEPQSATTTTWTVPLLGGETCTDSTHCTDILTPPTEKNQLQYLAIGKGVITYSCADRGPEEAPIYIQQEAYLYDAAPLIPKFSSEAQFHSYIPRFLDYDYTSLANSSLNCIGTIQTIQGVPIFDLYDVDAFPVHVMEVLNSPNNSQFDLKWAHSSDDNETWNIYRVETAGGGSPYDCGDQIINDEIPSEYVAEYWFYQNFASEHSIVSLVLPERQAQNGHNL